MACWLFHHTSKDQSEASINDEVRIQSSAKIILTICLLSTVFKRRKKRPGLAHFKKYHKGSTVVIVWASLRTIQVWIPHTDKVSFYLELTSSINKRWVILAQMKRGLVSKLGQLFLPFLPHNVGAPERADMQGVSLWCLKHLFCSQWDQMAWLLSCLLPWKFAQVQNNFAKY